MQYWTSRGISRIQREIEELRTKIGAFPKQRSDASYGRGIWSEDMASETYESLKQEGLVASMLATKTLLMQQLQQAPVPKDTVRTQVGHVVLFKYLTDSGRYIEAESTEKVIIGGGGESDTDSNPRTISCDSPLGRALFGKKVGEEAECFAPTNPYEVQILSIEVYQEEEPGLEVAKAA